MESRTSKKPTKQFLIPYALIVCLSVASPLKGFQKKNIICVFTTSRAEILHTNISDSTSEEAVHSLTSNNPTQQKSDSVLSVRTKETTPSTEHPMNEITFPMGKISFADSVVLYDPGALGKRTGDEPDQEFQKPESALGDPDHNSDRDSGYVSLGKGGTLVLKFTDNVLVDGPGPDLHIFELNTDAEDIFVWISRDGKIFIPVGKVSKQTPSIDIRPYAQPGATYSYIKLRDNPAQGEQEGPTVGADIDAVGAINTAIRMEIPTDELFISGIAKLSQDGPRLLSKIAEKVRQITHAKLSIEAYTDNRGTEDFNLLLSQQQAGAVQNYLLDVEHLTEVHYSVLGWGDLRPIASNDTEEGRRKNRRVEILIQTR